MKTLLLILLLIISSSAILAQSPANTDNATDSLKREILKLKTDVDDIQMRLKDSNRTLKQGVFVATLGYTVTIIGGQLLGTKPELGEALLYTGGAIGIGGTFVLMKGFNKLKKKE